MDPQSFRFHIINVRLRYKLLLEHNTDQNGYIWSVEPNVFDLANVDIFL